MLFLTIVKVAFRSIAANKLRSFLTMLGVIIGVAAVIAMLGLGAGTKEKVTESVRNMGANLLVVRAGARSMGGAWTGTQQNLKTDDAAAILKQVREITMVSPEVSNRFQVKYMNKNSSVNVSGEPVTYFPVRNFVIEKGRCFTEAEVNRNAKVAVLG